MAEETRQKQAKEDWHEKRLQDKLKNKNWDPVKEMLEIMDEYEKGTPKRSLKETKDDWGACCLESQDVDVAQNPESNEKQQDNLSGARLSYQDKNKPSRKP